MSEKLKETLLDSGRWFRAEIEREWHPTAIHPHYRYDKDNASYGFCGITSVEYGRRLQLMAGLAQMAIELQEAKPSDKRLKMALESQPETISRIFEATKGVIGSKALFAYGSLEMDNDIIHHDHCWVVLERDHEMYDLDETADQLSTDGLDLPPVMVQRLGEYDGHVIRHIAHELVPIDAFDSSPLAERLQIMTNNLGGWKHGRMRHPWDHAYNTPRIISRYEALKQIT